MKVVGVIGTRPDAVKLLPVMRTLRERFGPQSGVVCATAQHREMADQVLRVFGIEPDHDLDVMEEDQALHGLTAILLERLSGVFERERPDVVLVVGDTTTGFAASLAAFYARIRVGHVEAGLRTGKRYGPFPEEVLRRCMTQLATYQFAPTRQAVENLLAERLPEDVEIYETGNPVVDAIQWILSRQPPESPPVGQRVILVTAHRRENFGEPLRRICRALVALTERHADVQVIYPVHPNPNVSRPVREMLAGRERITLLPPLAYPDFVRLMAASYLILTDSGGIQEEAPVLGKPVLVMREATERPEAIAAGAALLVGTNDKVILRAADHLLTDERAYREMALSRSPFGDGGAAQRIVDILQQRLEGVGSAADRYRVGRKLA